MISQAKVFFVMSSTDVILSSLLEHERFCRVQAHSCRFTKETVSCNSQYIKYEKQKSFSIKPKDFILLK
jgi:hypothetical protein